MFQEALLRHLLRTLWVSSLCPRQTSADPSSSLQKSEKWALLLLALQAQTQKQVSGISKTVRGQGRMRTQVFSEGPGILCNSFVQYV